MKKSTIFAIIIIVVGILVMGLAAYRIWELKQVYVQADSTYDDLSSMVRKNTETGARASMVNNTGDDGFTVNNLNEAIIHIPTFELDFEMLVSINEDAVAWLYSPDTVIDYPVMRADDYEYYLNHLADGTVNANGSLFIDYNNAHDFSEELTVIYGHHMKSGSMFGSIVGYKEQAYFDKHPFMYLYTQNESYRIDLLYGRLVSASEWIEHGFMHASNIEDLLSFSAAQSTFSSDASYEKGDRIIILSTCSYEFNDARYFLVGILRAGE
ncbi:MAG: class B sortase [Oscillospiraceae bacterium]|nr:class B sortase [Oscillospiraceae bacterium]